MKNLLLIALVVLLIGAFIIKSQSGLSISSQEDRREFAVQFTHWAKRLGTNIKGVTAYVVKLDWVPDKPPEYEPPRNTQNNNQTG